MSRPVKRRGWISRIIEFAIMMTIAGSLSIAGLAIITDTVGIPGWP
jgi:hypothetical protein